MNVTIYAPYTNSELTWAAMVLAEGLERLGCSITWAAAYTRLDHVHWRWDLRVRSALRRGLRDSLKLADVVITFMPTIAFVREKTRCAPAARLIGVVGGSLPTRLDSVALAMDHDHLVCPSRLVWLRLRATLATEYGVGMSRIPASWVDWGYASALGQRSPVSRQRTVLVLCRAEQISELDAVTRHLRVALLGDRIVVVSERRPCRGASAHLGVEVQHLHLDNWQPLLRAADVVLSVRPTRFGSLELESLAAGVPVAAHDVEPLSSLICGLRCGLVSPCTVSRDWLGGQTAVIDSKGLVDICLRLVREPAFPDTDSHWRHNLLKRQQDFEAYWTTLLGL